MTFAFMRLSALVLALGLAGCGVKGALEPPPDSGLQPHAAASPASSAPATVPVTPGMMAGPDRPIRSPSVSGIARGTTSDAVVQSPAAQRRSVLDWLID